MASQLVELVNLWDAYETENSGNASISDFCRLYLQKQKDEPIVSDHLDSSVSTEMLPPINQLGKIFGRLGRFGGVYFKKALDSLEISTLNDMHYLNALQGKESIRKSELIQMNISDFTTGIEVINRLLKRGFVEEISDLEDKRSKRIRITDKGQVMRKEMILRLSKLSEFVFGALSEDERDILLQLYKKLDLYHTSIYKDFQGLSFEEIVEKEQMTTN